MSYIIPELEEKIREKEAMGWATSEVKKALVRYWGAPGAKREEVWEKVCSHFGLDIPFGRMRYYVEKHLADDIRERKKKLKT